MHSTLFLCSGSSRKAYWQCDGLVHASSVLVQAIVSRSQIAITIEAGSIKTCCNIFRVTVRVAEAPPGWKFESSNFPI